MNEQDRRVLAAYAPERLLASVQAERDHWKDANEGNFERAKQEYDRADDLEALLVRVMRHPEVRAVVGPELIRLTNDATGAGWPWEYPGERERDENATAVIAAMKREWDDAVRDYERSRPPSEPGSEQGQSQKPPRPR